MSQTPRSKSFRLQNSQAETTNNPRVEAFLAAQAVGAVGTSTETSSSPASLAASVAPRIVAITPDNGFSSTDLVTNVSRVTLRGSGTAGSRVYIQVDGNPPGVVTVASNGTWQWTPSTGIGNGPHRITAYSLAADGTRLNSNVATVTIDPAAPDLTLNNLAVGSDTGASASDFITQNRNLTLTGTGEAGSRLTLSFNGGAPIAVTIGSNGVWTYDLPRDLADGTYQVTLRETDRAGNVTTRTQEVAIDTVGPTAQINSLYLAATAGAVNGSFGLSEAVSYRLESQAMHGTATVNVGGTYSYIPVAGYRGTDSFSITLSDVAGNESRHTVQIAIRGEGEFQVNTTVDREQFYSSITGLADGGFVVTWNSTIQDGDGYGVYGQRYDSAGDKVGGEFLINSTRIGNQIFPQIAALADGGFIATWYSDYHASLGSGIYGQRYDRQGVLVGAEFKVSTTAISNFGEQDEPAVTVLTNGDFIITWTGDATGGPCIDFPLPFPFPCYEIYGQRYDRNGNSVGSQFEINNTTYIEQAPPSITALANGGFVVTWVGINLDVSYYGPFAQRYDASGAKAGAEITLATTTATGQQITTTALTNGNFVVIWDSDPADGSGPNLYGQVCDTQGVPIGGNFRINNYTPGIQAQPAAVALATGGFVVVWQSEGQDGSLEGIFAQIFDANGIRIGSELGVNTTVVGRQNRPDIAALSDGGFVVTWSSQGQDSGSSYGVYAQRYNADGRPYGVVLTGGNDRDVLTGGIAADTLDGGAGDDTLRGGTGDDRYILDTAADLVVETANQGTDTVEINFAAPNYTLTSHVENLILGTNAIGGTGNDLNNVLTGNGGDNILNGAAGNDVLNGLGGNDTLNGGTGADTLIGGSGNDYYIVDNSSDQIIENLNEGIDTAEIQAAAYTLGNNIENAILGAGGINVTGNSVANNLIGNADGNNMRGGDGNDVIDGGIGNDTIDGEGENDYLSGGSGDDVINGGTGSGQIGRGNDTLDGGAGADTLDGGNGGADRIIYGAGALQVVGAVDTIRNFDASGTTTSGDRIDLSGLLTSLGFANDAALRALGTAFQIADQGGGNYDLRIDADRSGGGSFEVTLARIQVIAGTLDAADFILV